MTHLKKTLTLLLLLSLFLFQACSKDDNTTPTSENKYLIDVTVERRIPKAE